MANEIRAYKDKVIAAIINDADIVEAIDNNDAVNPEDLVYSSIFPYIKIPDTIEEVRTFILMSVDINRILNNRTFHEISITIWVLSHQNHMKTNYGCTRIDYIADRIEKLFNLNGGFGYKDLQLIKNRERVLNNKHLYRELVFVAQDIRKDISSD